MTADPAPAPIKTPDQRLRVFISSTMKELAPERTAARDAVSHLRLTPVLFEMGARPYPPRDLYRAYLEQSHLFIGIYGAEYGWVAPGMEVSGLEDEFLLAGDRPRLIYVKSVPERDPRLQAMLNRITEEGSSSYQRFSTPEELQALIENDLAVILSERFDTPSATDDGVAIPPVPVPLTPAVGRDDDIIALTRILSDDATRLVTLSGPGGIGKTRLALAVAERLQDHFPDGVAFVPLAGVTNAPLIAPEIAARLGIYDSGERAIIDTVSKHLATKRLLLILDNFEHLVEGAGIITELLSAASGVRALVTSRRLLRVYGEREYVVSPLEIPQQSTGSLDLGPAVELFAQRAAWALPGFEITRDNTQAVVEICRRLDGIPLAIELAAARMRVLTPEALLDRLSTGLDVLSSGPRDLPARQQTMRNTIQWSYDLLEPWEKHLFAQVSVFSGGFSTTAAEAVCDCRDIPDGDLLTALASLAEHSLLSLVHGAIDAPRFRMLEVVREFALEKLRADGDEAATRARHVRYFAGMMDDAETVFYRVGGERWMDLVDAEQDNLRAALEWTLSAPGTSAADPDRPIANITLAFYWYLTGHFSEGRDWSGRLLERAARTGDERDLANALLADGCFAMWQGELSTARRQLERCVEIWRRIGRDDQLAMALMVLGASAVNQGDSKLAREVLHEALAFYQKTNMDRNTSVVLMHLGNAAAQLKEYDHAAQHFEEGLALSRKWNDTWMLASLLNNLGEVARCRFDHPAARTHYAEALDLFEQQNAVSDAARIIHNLAYCELRSGDITAATTGFHESLNRFERLNNGRGIGECLIGLAAALAEAGDPVRGARLLGAGSTMLNRLGATLWPADQVEYQTTVDTLRNALGQATYEVDITEGANLTREEALALAGE